MRMEKTIIKKILVGLLCAVVLAVGIVPFIDANAGSGKIQLIVDLHGYTPSTSRIPTADDPDVFNSTYYIAEAFMEENPDIEIVWARTKPVGGLDAEVAQWFTTQIAGGTVPAIAFSWGTRYQDRDWYLPLDEYLNDEWTYEGDYGTWKNVFRDYLWDSPSVVNARGEVVGIPITVYPGAATGYFYNKTAFKRAGLEGQLPETWKEFTDFAQKLSSTPFKEHPTDPSKNDYYIGVAPWSYFSTATVFDAWVWGSVFSPSFGGYTMKLGADYDGNGSVTSAEQARACLQGIYSTKNDYAREMYKLFKKFYTDTLEDSWSSIEYYGDWLDGRVAMREEGIWALPVENSTYKEFEFGVFVSPLVDNTSLDFLDPIQYSNGPYEPEPDLVVNIMKAAVKDKPEVLDAALRFLKYMTKPENVSMICIENAGVLGAVKNTGHSEIIDEFINARFPITPSAGWPAGFTDEFKDKLNRLFERWINDQVTDEDFFTQVDIIQKDGANSFIRRMGLDTSGWTVA